MHVESYPGGMGGCFWQIVARVLGLEDLGCIPEGGGMCTIIHIEARE